MNKKNRILKNHSMEKETHPSFNELWNKALSEVEDNNIEKTLEFIKQENESLRKEKEFINKNGKEPEPKTPDGKVNQKFIEYILKRDYGIEPDSGYDDPYKDFSWNGLVGIEAYIAKWNCE